MDCGVLMPIPGQQPHWVLCSAVGIPPPRKPGVGDPFVAIERTGKPRLELESQDEFETSKIATLRTGVVWTNLGVMCKVKGKAVTCSNASGHGFTIGTGTYKPF